MPWCPKCRSEYRQGFTVCSDCGSTLVEAKPADEQTADPEGAYETAGPVPILKTEANRAIYQSNSQRADENRSSAWVLLIVGALGLIVVMLGITEVLPLKMANPYLFYGVMGAIFVLFVVAGIVSMKNARVFIKKAESENSLKTTMLDWCRQNLDGQEIDKEIGSDETSEEERYFNRVAYLCERLNRQFMNLDQDFLEHFIDDQIYDMIFDVKGIGT